MISAKSDQKKHKMISYFLGLYKPALGAGVPLNDLFKMEMFLPHYKRYVSGIKIYIFFISRFSRLQDIESAYL
jgi:hypothetical protein